MEYRFANAASYEDYASGRVLYNQRGTTAFPVRLASEIFKRCRQHLQARGIDRPLSLYDPCCGGAFMLTALGFLHGDDLASITASDIDPEAVQLAAKNLALLTSTGLTDRVQQLRQLLADYGKGSHQEALASAERLQGMLNRREHSPEVHCFQANALKLAATWPATMQVDLVITDLPYGHLVQWGGEAEDPVPALLSSLTSVLHLQAVVAVVADKQPTIRHPAYQRLERFQVGKRQVVILGMKNESA